ncbi:Guanine nucleotide exchange factor for Cdc42p [Dispira simplex]|nr:Guanine nucleotide exchange factor for Cdc42p [Dispira simplex]
MHSVSLRRRAPSQVGSVHTIDLPTPSTPLPTNAPAASLYQRCLHLMDRLALVPGFAPFLEPKPCGSANATGEERMSDQAFSGSPPGQTVTESYLDPVQYLWGIFRDGYSLITIYNALRPETPIVCDLKPSMTEQKKEKVKIFNFIKAIKELDLMADSQMLIVSDIFRDDTNAFIKILNIVTALLDRLEKEGRLLPLGPNIVRPSLRFSDNSDKKPENNREKVVAEILDTERKYVNDLITLQRYMQEIQSQHILPEETTRLMFANLSALLDFQQRFLIGIEGNARKSASEQQFGALFVKMESGFSVYEPYIANHKRASEIAQREAGTLAKLSNILDPTFQLQSLLIKPVQRICKYELLYRELIRFSDSDAPNYSDIQEGYEAAKRIANRTNETIRREENYHALKDLEARVVDWNKMDLAKFGELHLFDRFTMTTSDIVNELQFYLFDDSLICCKDVEPGKENRKSQKHQSQGSIGTGPESAEAAARRKKGTLLIKGRVHLYKIHHISNVSRNGILSLTFYWRDMVMEQFSLRFRTEDQLNLWKSTIERLSKLAKEKEELRRQALIGNATVTSPSTSAASLPPSTNFTAVAHPTATNPANATAGRVEPNMPEYIMLHPAKASLANAIPPIPTTPVTPGFFAGGNFTSPPNPNEPMPNSVYSYGSSMGSVPTLSTMASSNGTAVPPKLTHSLSHNHAYHYVPTTPGATASYSSNYSSNTMSLPPGSSHKQLGLGDDRARTASPRPDNGETYFFYRPGGNSTIGEGSRDPDGVLADGFTHSVQVSRESSHHDVVGGRKDGTRSVSAEMSQHRPTNGAPGPVNYAPLSGNLLHPNFSGARTPMGVESFAAAGQQPFRDRSGSTPNIYTHHGDRRFYHPGPSALGTGQGSNNSGDNPRRPSGGQTDRHLYPQFTEENGWGDTMSNVMGHAYASGQSPPSILTVRNTNTSRNTPTVDTQSAVLSGSAPSSRSAHSSPVEANGANYPPLPTPSLPMSSGAYHGHYPGGTPSVYNDAAGPRRSPSNSLSHGSGPTARGRGSPPRPSQSLSPLAQSHADTLPAPPHAAVPLVKVKVNYRGDVFALIVPCNISYRDLSEKVEHKIDICTGRRTHPSEEPGMLSREDPANAGTTAPLRFTYRDEDGDYIKLDNDADFQMALETRQRSPLLPGAGAGLMANSSPVTETRTLDGGSGPGLTAGGLWSINIFVS